MYQEIYAQAVPPQFFKVIRIIYRSHVNQVKAKENIAADRLDRQILQIFIDHFTRKLRGKSPRVPVARSVLSGIHRLYPEALRWIVE